jgi:hypothetical protein
VDRTVLECGMQPELAGELVGLRCLAVPQTSCKATTSASTARRVPTGRSCQRARTAGGPPTRPTRIARPPCRTVGRRSRPDHRRAYPARLGERTGQDVGWHGRVFVNTNRVAARLGAEPSGSPAAPRDVIRATMSAYQSIYRDNSMRLRMKIRNRSWASDTGFNCCRSGRGGRRRAWTPASPAGGGRC